MNVFVPIQASSRRSKVDPSEEIAWEPARGPDRSSLLVAVPAQHTRQGTPADYAPARDVPIPPEKSSGRSTCYYLDPTDWLIKVAEGQLEMNATLRFIADPHVVRIEPQFGPVWYLPAEGKRTHTVFDFRVTYDTPAKSVVSVKRAAQAHKLKTDELNQLILQQMPTCDADFVQLVTEQHLPQWALANFRLMHSVRNDGYWLCEKELREAASCLAEPVSIDEFSRPWGGARVVFRTVVLLLFDRTLLQPSPGEIDETTLVVGKRKEQGQ